MLIENHCNLQGCFRSHTPSLFQRKNPASTSTVKTRLTKNCGQSQWVEARRRKLISTKSETLHLKYDKRLEGDNDVKSVMCLQRSPCVDGSMALPQAPDGVQGDYSGSPGAFIHLWAVRRKRSDRKVLARQRKGGIHYFVVEELYYRSGVTCCPWFPKRADWKGCVWGRMERG